MSEVRSRSGSQGSARASGKRPAPSRTNGNGRSGGGRTTATGRNSGGGRTREPGRPNGSRAIGRAQPGSTRGSQRTDVQRRRQASAAAESWSAPAEARWRPITALVLSIAGFGDSLYLTIEHYTGNANLVCSNTSTVNCLKVTTSPESMVFGIFPVALLGLLFFVGMLALNLPVMWRTSVRLIAMARLAMVVIGMGFVFYLLYSELISIKAICLWCTGVHAITFLLFVLVLSSQATIALLRPPEPPAA
jgi:uncharacterized membrane protein